MKYVYKDDDKLVFDNYILLNLSINNIKEYYENKFNINIRYDFYGCSDDNVTLEEIKSNLYTNLYLNERSIFIYSIIDIDDDIIIIG